MVQSSVFGSAFKTWRLGFRDVGRRVAGFQAFEASGA